MVASEPAFWSEAFWTNGTHVLIALNALLALGTIVTAGVSLATIRSSNRVAAAAEGQTETMSAELVATNQQLGIDRQALQTSTKPLIVGTIEEGGNIAMKIFQQLPTEAEVLVPVVNIGQGPAVIFAVSITLERGLTNFRGDADQKILARDGATFVRARHSDIEAVKAAIEQKSFSVAIRYSDISGSQRSETVLAIGGHFDWPTVERIEFFELHQADEVRRLVVSSGI
jgi:hypothetical protein